MQEYKSKRVSVLLFYFCTLVLFYLPTPAEAATYWVHPTGNNGACTNTITPQGSGGNAKTTILAGIACLNSGDTLNIRAGTYNEKIASDETIIVSGSSGAPTVIQAYGSETVTMRHSTPTVRELIRLTNTLNNQWITFRNLTLDCFNVVSGGGTSPSCMQVGQDAQNIVFEGLEVSHNSGAQLSADQGTGFHQTGTNISFIKSSLRACKIYDTGRDMSGNPGNGHKAQGGSNGAYGTYWSGTGGLIDGCELYGNGFYGIHNYASSGGVDNHTFRNNRIYNNGNGIGGAGILTASGSNNRVYNNVIYNNYTGISVAGFDGHTCTNCVVNSNTIYGNEHYGLEVFNSTGTIARNNIFQANADAQFNEISSITKQQNLCAGSGGTTNCQVTGDPNMVNPAGGDFRLQASSTAALNVGITLGAPYNTDILGASRPDGAYDLGAYEYGAPVVGPVTDNFDRANGALGANWSGGYTGRTDATIVTNKVRGTTLSSNMVAVWTAPIGLNQAPTVILSTVGAGLNGDGGLLLRASATPSVNFYYIAATKGAASTTYIYRCQTGTCTGVASDATQTWVSGDVLKAAITDASGLITVYKNNVSFMTYTDPSPIVGTRTGIGSFSANALGDIELDDFYVGGTPIPDVTGRVVKIQSGQTLKLGQQ